MSELRSGKAQQLASTYRYHCVEPCGMRLHHPPKSSFGQFNYPVILDDEIEVGVEANAVYRRKSWLP